MSRTSNLHHDSDGEASYRALDVAIQRAILIGNEALRQLVERGGGAVTGLEVRRPGMVKVAGFRDAEVRQSLSFVLAEKALPQMHSAVDPLDVLGAACHRLGRLRSGVVQVLARFVVREWRSRGLGWPRRPGRRGDPAHRRWVAGARRAGADEDDVKSLRVVMARALERAQIEARGGVLDVAAWEPTVAAFRVLRGLDDPSLIRVLTARRRSARLTPAQVERLLRRPAGHE